MLLSVVYLDIPSRTVRTRRLRRVFSNDEVVDGHVPRLVVRDLELSADLQLSRARFVTPLLAFFHVYHFDVSDKL